MKENLDKTQISSCPVKLHILEHFLQAWIPIYSTNNENLLYLDLFAGTTEYSFDKIEIDGPSIRVIAVFTEFFAYWSDPWKERKVLDKFYLWFVESNRENYDKLIINTKDYLLKKLEQHDINYELIKNESQECQTNLYYLLWKNNFRVKLKIRYELNGFQEDFDLHSFARECNQKFILLDPVYDITIQLDFLKLLHNYDILISTKETVKKNVKSINNEIDNHDKTIEQNSIVKNEPIELIKTEFDIQKEIEFPFGVHSKIKSEPIEVKKEIEPYVPFNSGINSDLAEVKVNSELFGIYSNIKSEPIDVKKEDKSFVSINSITNSDSTQVKVKSELLGTSSKIKNEPIETKIKTENDPWNLKTIFKSELNQTNYLSQINSINWNFRARKLLKLRFTIMNQEDNIYNYLDFSTSIKASLKSMKESMFIYDQMENNKPNFTFSQNSIDKRKILEKSSLLSKSYNKKLYHENAGRCVFDHFKQANNSEISIDEIEEYVWLQTPYIFRKECIHYCGEKGFIMYYVKPRQTSGDISKLFDFRANTFNGVDVKFFDTEYDNDTLKQKILLQLKCWFPSEIDIVIFENALKHTALYYKLNLKKKPELKKFIKYLKENNFAFISCSGKNEKIKLL